MSISPTRCTIPLVVALSSCSDPAVEYAGSDATGARIVPVVLTVTDPIEGGDITLKISGVPDSEHSVVSGDAAGASQQGNDTFAVGGDVQVFPVITTDADGWGSWTGPLKADYEAGDTLRFQAIATDAALADHPASRVVIRDVVTDVVAPPMRNVLILLADDMGVDRMAIYDGPDTPDYLAPTPNLDVLAEEGLVFSNMWSMHVCGPSRVALQTGRYPRRTGWGMNANIEPETIPIVNTDDPELDAGFITLGELVKHSPWHDYDTAHLGKWQINTPYSDTSFELGSVSAAVHSQGYEWFQGTIIGVESWFGSTAAPNGLSFFKFGMFENDGSYVLMDGGDATYATTVQAGDAVEWITNEAPIDRPWLLVVAFNAPHDPHHVPPDALYTGPVPASDTDKQLAAIEAMDTEIGSILDVVDLEDTLVIFTSDNGTDGSAAGSGEVAGKMKNTLYEGGIRVPLIVAGAGLSPDFSNDIGEVDFSEALVSVVDIFPTIAEIVGVDPTELPSNLEPETVPLAIDGVSFAGVLDGTLPEGLREFAYAERFEPGGSHEVWGYELDHMAIRDASHKLMWDGVSDTEIGFFAYDAEGHAVGITTLTADDIVHYDALKAEMDEIRAGLVYDSAQWSDGPAIAVNEFLRDSSFDAATGTDWIERSRP